MTLVKKREGGTYYAVWRVPAGDGRLSKQKWKSTGASKRTEAEIIRNLWAEAIRKGRVSEAFRARTAELQRELLGGQSLVTVRAHVEAYVESFRERVSGPTFGNHGIKKMWLLKWMEQHKLADKDLSFLQRQHLQAFLDDERKRNAASTVNTTLTWLKALFRTAVEEGMLVDNPAAKLLPFKQLANEKPIERRVFTEAEVQSLLAVAPPEWRSMIMFAVYTGQRLMDIALLRWKDVDIIHAEIRLTTRKTSRRTIPPIGAPLMAWLLKQEMPDDGNRYVHPQAAELVAGTRRSNKLSKQFEQLLKNAKLRAPGRRKKQAGEKKITHELSFHCFRHTCTTWLKQAGASSSVAQDYIGHDSAATNEIYTHIDNATKRRFADLLPDVTIPKSK